MSIVLTHKHHIVPRHMGGSNDPDNLIELSVSDHAEAHKKLFEKHGHWQDKIAYQMLSGQIESDNVRRELSRARMLNENPMHDPAIVLKALEKRKGYKHSESTKKRMSKAQKGIPKSNTENMGKHSIKEYLLVDPNGKEYVISNLSKFCKEQGLTESLMYKVASGVRNHHQKWKCSLLPVMVV